MVVNEDDGYRLFVCNTVTGLITADLTAAGQKYGLRLNASGTVTATLRPRAQEFTGMSLKSHTRPLYQSLGVAYRGRVLECGPIWTRDVDEDSGNLELGAESLDSIFATRKALPGWALTQGADATAAVLNMNGALGDIARELVRISLEDNPYGAGGLNVVFPVGDEGGAHVRTWYGYDLASIEEQLRELSEVQGGPDIRFRPRFAADPRFVEWVMEYGTGAQPLLQQVGADWVWDGTAEESGVVGFGTSEDARGMASKAWVPGSGQERSMRLASATSTDLVEDGFPWTETDTAAKETEDLGILQGLADQDLEDAAGPWHTFKIKVRADVAPHPGEYRPGDWARVIVPNDHPTLDPGPVRVRIMAVDGDGSNTVALTVAPVQDTTQDLGGAGVTTVDSNGNGAPATWSALPPGTWATLPEGGWNEVI